MQQSSATPKNQDVVIGLQKRITVSYLKRLTNVALGRLQAFRMYGGIGMSVSSLHRESTD